MSSSCTTGDTVSGVSECIQVMKNVPKEPPTSSPSICTHHKEIQTGIPSCWLPRLSYQESLIDSVLLRTQSSKMESTGIPHNNTILFRCCEKVTKKCPLLLVGWSAHSSSCFVLFGLLPSKLFMPQRLCSLFMPSRL